MSILRSILVSLVLLSLLNAQNPPYYGNGTWPVGTTDHISSAFGPRVPPPLTEGHMTFMKEWILVPHKMQMSKQF